MLGRLFKRMMLNPPIQVDFPPNLLHPFPKEARYCGIFATFTEG